MNSKSIFCIRGDISQSRAQAIVNAANNHLWMGSGVADAIKRMGGSEIKAEAIDKGPIEVGQAVATGAGRLSQKYVIHAAAMGQDLRTDATKIRQATRNSLYRAEELGLESVDFPALGTGVGGFPPDEAAVIMVSETRQFLADSKSLKKVGFILFDNETFQAFRAALGGTAEDL